MDYEVLVSELRQLLALLQQEQAQMTLFMLKAIETETNDWNLIVSTREYDQLSTKQAMYHLANFLNTHLSPNMRKHILRLTILKTNDDFVKELNASYQVTNAPQYIQSVFIGSIFIEKAIIFASQRFPVTKRTHLQEKQTNPLLEHA